MTASDLPTPHQIPLTGNGVSAGLEISPASLSFGNTFVGSSSAGQSVTISNVSGGVVTLQSISASGPFQQSNNCGTTLAFGGTCTAQITFSPTVLGNANGSLTVQDNASGNPHSATLSGVATGTAIKLSSTDLIFSNRALNTTSPASPVVVTNQMSMSISISAITTSGDFAQTNNCGSSLAAGASCTINVTFQPTALGLRSGSVSISDNAPGSPQIVAVSGNGTATPALSISPTSLDFGGVLVSGSASQNVTLSVSNAPLSIDGIDSTSSLFTTHNQCPFGFAPGNPCLILIFFKPTALGPVSATMHIQDDAAGSPQSIQLTGVGSHYTLFGASGGGQIITAGQTATFNVNLNSLSGLSETVSVTCSGAPLLSTCNLSQSSFSLTGNAQLFHVTVATTARTASLLRSPTPLGPTLLVVLWLGGFLAIWVTLVVLLNPKSQLSSLPVRPLGIFSMAIAIGLVLGILSCGGGSGGPNGTPAGQYNVVITGTSSNPANPTQVVQLPFSVQ